MPTPVSTAVLKAVPLFANVPEEQLRMLTVVVTRKSVARSPTSMAGGDATDSLYIVLSGRLKVMMSDSEGKEVILAILGPGEFFGEMGLIDDSPRSASVVAIESCELLSIAKRDFKKCLAENFEMTMAVMRGLGRRLRGADRKIGRLPRAGGRVLPRRPTAAGHVGDRGRRKNCHQAPAEAGHRQNDRRIARDGEPGDEGPANGRLHRSAR